MKKYDDFDWNFDEEEEPQYDIKKGDRIILKKTNYYRSQRNDPDFKYLPYKQSHIFDLNSNYHRNGFTVMETDIKKDGTPIMKIGDNWPWYDCSYWKKKEENYSG